MENIKRVIGKNSITALYYPPEKGELSAFLRHKEVSLLIGHAAYRNHENIRKLLESDIAAATAIYPDTSVAIVISDGSYTEQSGDTRTIDEAVNAAERVFEGLPEGGNGIHLLAAPYEGYCDRRVSGKGSALRMIFDEIEGSFVKDIFLLDSDLRNDFLLWFKAYRLILTDHKRNFPTREAFITARYARHFIDASLTRNVIGPLTTLMGTFVPGGISGDIVLTAGATAIERRAEWNRERMGYGTDIATTMDNIAAGTVIYEAALGAKLHDITDDTRLQIMPREVIASALERLLYYEKLDGRISRLVVSEVVKLQEPIYYGKDKTGIDFINPGFTALFKIDFKREMLYVDFVKYQEALKTVLSDVSYNEIKFRRDTFMNSEKELFIGVTQNKWRYLLYEAIRYLLRSGDMANTVDALVYLYRAAFLETVTDRLFDLGYSNISGVRMAECKLGVADEKAEKFYREKVDLEARKLAVDFFDGRHLIGGEL